MAATIVVIVFLLFAIPGAIMWLLRPRQDVKPGPFHDDYGPGVGGGPVDPGGHP